MSKISIKNISQAIYETDADPKSVVDFLYKKGLLSKSEEILKELEKISHKNQSIMKMKVISAHKLSENKQKELEHEMREKYNLKHVESQYYEDKNLLGGIKIEIGEDIIDTTYRNKLNQLANHLIQK